MFGKIVTMKEFSSREPERDLRQERDLSVLNVYFSKGIALNFFYTRYLQEKIKNIANEHYLILSVQFVFQQTEIFFSSLLKGKVWKLSKGRERKGDRMRSGTS